MNAGVVGVPFLGNSTALGLFLNETGRPGGPSLPFLEWVGWCRAEVGLGSRSAGDVDHLVAELIVEAAADHAVRVDERGIRWHLIKTGRALDAGHPTGRFGIRFVEDVGDESLPAVVRTEAHEFGADLSPRVIVAANLQHRAENSRLAGSAEGNGTV